MRRELGLDLEAEQELRELGLDPGAEQELQLGLEAGRESELDPEVCRELGLDPEAGRQLGLGLAAGRKVRLGPEARRELDREYSPSSLVDDPSAFLDRYAADSARARATLTVHRDLRCGPLPEQRFDYFPAPGEGAPLFVFVHGGYWQELSKAEAAFAARDFVAAGISFAALGYGLAPAYGMRQLTAAAVDSLHWICAHRASLPGAPAAVHLGGHSAGAHLVASALLDAEAGRRAGPRPAGTIASATLLSGVYDLELLRHTYVNDALGMDTAEARECSPLRRLPQAEPSSATEAAPPQSVPPPQRALPPRSTPPPRGAALPPLLVARGERETTAFDRQQVAFVRRARAAGAAVTDLVVPDRHHFDLPLDLARPGTALGAEVMRVIRSTGPVGVDSGAGGGESGSGAPLTDGTLVP
ncbi:alpha/beta hydrolase [Streptomyces sp. CC224B]|uniref:alpha/beta hydrolase n=1 Tax=Streptomyces sp. CC224B TaxID=3044571 RepID=UPI0024A8FCCB|nr:alpha/beta hydrolase [Streptomyces sp. CC224B]